MASRGKHTQLNHMFTADFETCDTDVLYKTIEDDEGNKTDIYNQRVWLAGFKNLETMQSTYFNNLDDFMNAILARGDNMNTEYAFHNLKFDGSYIVPWLHMNNYEVTTQKPEAGQFSVLVDGRNAWYSITIQVTKRRKVLIWDSLKLFPTSLEYLPDVYSTPTHKVAEDSDWYSVKRPEDYIPDARDMHYFENDLQVPAEALNEHIKLYGLQFKKTQASQAFYNFEKSFKAWKFRFPALTNQEDADIRNAYWGGISYVNKNKVGLDFFDLAVYDINSSYPDKAANSKLPYGPCVATFGEGQHPDMSKFWVAEALVEFTLKEGCLPCIPKKAIDEGTIVEDKDVDADKWLDDSEGIVRMKFSCIDYVTIQESYENFKVYRWIWTRHWAWKVQKEIAKFVYKNNDIKVGNKIKAKAEPDPLKMIELLTQANRAKIDNNAFYGKFGEDIIKEGKTPYWEPNEDGIEEVVWRVDRQEVQGERSRKYLPVAIAITAWGRQQLVRMWNTLGENALYCDTDSLHFEKAGQKKIDIAIKNGSFIVDDTKLGAWKHEGDMVRGRYLRAKCYLEQTTDGHIEATVAGLPADPHTGQFSKKRSCLNWDNFHIGLVIPEEQTHKLRTVRTPTGNKLLPTHYQIKEKDALFG